MKSNKSFQLTGATFVGASVLGLALFHPAPVMAETKLILNIFTGASHPFARINTAWADAATKASDGDLKFRVPVKTLAPAQRQWSVVTSGVADVAATANAFETRRLTLPELATLPFSTTVSGQKSSIALWKTYKKFFESANEYKGVKLLGMFLHPGGDLNMLKSKISKAEDFKNLKIRVSRGMASKGMKAMDAVLVVTPGSKTFEVVSKGIVDGAVLPMSDIFKFKMMPFVKTIYTLPGKFYNTPFSTIMNQQKWDGLSAENKKAINVSTGINIARLARLWDDQTVQALPHLKKAGIKIEQINDDVVRAMRKKFASFDADWIALAAKKGIDGKAALTYYREQSKL